MAGRSAFGREKNNTMPGTSRTQQRAEARYNVTTQFPQYDLHFAAASGNLGLVEFALSHGQPINSVLNGVLPLHAACAGGSEVVVKYLIDEGADVNAPRIPRRYSNERHKSSGLAVGASGSTPLHFAAANGHLGVVKLLLAHGAVPDRGDKHGVTPEMLARENGWVECAEVLNEWSGGRAGDLPPVVKSSSVGEEIGTPDSAGDASVGDANANTAEKDRDGGCELAEFIQNIGSSSSSAGSKRLHVKRSIDNALHLFKAPLLHHHGSQGQLRVDRGRERDMGRGREKSPSPPSPSARSHTQAQGLRGAHSQIGSPSPGPGSHLHALFHHGHGHSHSASQLGPSSNATATATAKSLSHTSESPSPSLLPARLLGGDLSMTQSPISSSNPNPSVFDSAAGPGGVPSHRRPSLPHIFHDTPASPFQRRLSERKRRPRSAGEDAEKQDQIAQETSAGTADATDGANDRLGSTPSPVPAGAGGYSAMNTGTITTRKLSSKISLRNLFRRAQTTGSDPNPNLHQSGGGSEPGSNASSYAQNIPIYSLAYAPSSSTGSAGGGGIRGTAVASASALTPTPPASPLSASFTPSASPSPAPGSTGNGRPGSWYRSRLGSTSENTVSGPGPGPGTVPRSPLVPSAVELHHRYSQEQLQLQLLEEPEAQTQVIAPRLSARRSILRAHNRSVSSQSSNGSGTGTPAGGPRTLRFDASSAAAASSASPSPEPQWDPNMSTNTSVGNAGGNTSAMRLRGTRSASSLRHEHSFNECDDAEEAEEEEEDYGTSIAPSSPSVTRPGESSRVLAYGDAELEDGVARELGPSDATAGRTRGASFASTASYASSPGVEPADTDADGRTTYENKEFPFSLDKPPLTPLSATSELESATTRDRRPTSDDATQSVEDGSLLAVNARSKESDVKQRQAKGERKATTESRGRGNSFSSIETDESARSRNGNASSSTSAFTNIPTPSPGTDLRMAAVLGDDNDVPRTIRSDAPINGKRTSDTVYLHTSPSSLLEELDAEPDADDADADAEANQLQAGATAKAVSPMTPLGLDLRGISNLAEAEELVRRAQQAILASASLPANGPESPDVPLSAQLAAYGEILALERRFARGEKQRENWGVRDDDSDVERHDAAATTAPADLAKNGNGNEGDLSSRKPQSAKEARMLLTQKKRDALTTRQRGATTGSPSLGFGSSLRQKGVMRKPPKYKRPHTAEGAPQASWGAPVADMAHIISGSPSNSTTIGAISSSAGNASSGHRLSHSRSSSTPLYIGKEAEKLPDIAIIETTATPVDSPKTPESASAARTRVSPSPSAVEHPYTQYTLDDMHPALPLRSRTPDPNPTASTDDFGVPLTRVSTAPLQDSTGYGTGVSGSYGARGSSSALRSDPATRRTGSSHKLSKMGFSVDAHAHPPGTRHHIHQSHSASPHPRRVHGRDKARDAWDSGYAVYSGGGSPASSAGSSRSPSKARFGGIRSLVRGLKGKS